jgi:hypothetical protein
MIKRELVQHLLRRRPGKLSKFTGPNTTMSGGLTLSAGDGTATHEEP